MNWLSDELAEIAALIGAGSGATWGSQTPSVPPTTDGTLQPPRRLRNAGAAVARLERIAAEIARRPGVAAVFVSYDGLLLAAEGNGPDLEALAAVAQSTARAAIDTARGVALGQAQQVVVVGSEHKLALVIVAGMVLGILCATHTALAVALSAPPAQN
jgi:predicted regulator of Ras-like GTPase activity (Roadblock/LC7/MglB family)